MAQSWQVGARNVDERAQVVKTWALAFPALARPVYTKGLEGWKRVGGGSECRGFGWLFTTGKIEKVTFDLK